MVLEGDGPKFGGPLTQVPAVTIYKASEFTRGSSLRSSPSRTSIFKHAILRLNVTWD
jgi:hypothetical protein